MMSYYACLEKKGGGATLHLNKINDASRLFNILENKEEEKHKTPCVNIRFGTDYELYLKSLCKSVRQNIRTAYNRLEREGKKYKFEFYAKQQPNNKLIAEEMRIYNKRAEQRKKSKIPLIVKKIRTLFNPISVSTKKMNTAVHAYLYIDGKMVSFLTGYISNDGNTIVVPRHAIDDDYSVYCVGALLITNIIKYCIENTEIRNLDLSRGDEKYKYVLGGETHWNHAYDISADIRK